MLIYLLVIVCAISWGLTWVIRRYAIAKSILDIPNHRSSHVLPTPRGGGVAFIICFLLAIPALAYLGFVISKAGIAIIAAGLVVAALGFWDDRVHIPALYRLLGHLSACMMTIYLLNEMPPLSLLGWNIPPGSILNFLAVIYLTWLLNLYNFMDGIDGLAAIETITVCLGGALLYLIVGESLYIGLPLLLAAAVVGFLGWNFPPAKIFMGDAGSGFLGLVLGILTIQAAGVQQQLFWGWLILLGVFIVDATMTLFTRLVQGHKIYEAHRNHAYQHAAQDFGSHLSVTMAVLVINIFWLLPMAMLVAWGKLEGFTGLVIAYLPLIILAVTLKKNFNKCQNPI
jgi:Fuc2NAc and GlcNAc transferase